MPPATATPPAQARQQLLALLGPVVESAGYDLEDVTVSQAGRRSLIRAIVDRDGGIDLDSVAEVSRLISDALDAADGAPGAAGKRSGASFAGPYVLEVSSPGVDRPLTEPRHWRRAVGRLVQTQLGGTPVTARIRAADDHGVTLEVDGNPRRSGYAELGPGRIQVEFSHAADEQSAADDEPDDLDIADGEEA